MSMLLIFSRNYLLKIVSDSNNKIAHMVSSFSRPDDNRPSSAMPKRPDTMYVLLIMISVVFLSIISIFGRGGEFRAASGIGYVHFHKMISLSLNLL